MRWLIVFILFYCCGVLFAQGQVDGAAAIVDNNIILHSDVLQQAQFVALGRGIDPSRSPYLFEEIYISTLNNLINQHVVLCVAEKDTNIIISNDEVERALNQQIDNFIVQAGSEKKFLEMAGMSMHQIRTEYWKDIRDMMYVERLQFSKIKNIDASRVEVNSFFDVYKDSIPVVSEQYSFSVIELPFTSGNVSEHKTVDFLNGLKNQLEFSDVSFDSLAKVYSHDPGTSQSGGFLGFTTRGSLVKEYEEVAYSLFPGEISEPVRTPFGYHIIRLIDKQGEKISTQHILRTIEFSSEDKNSAIESLENILFIVKNDSLVFDSLANIYSKKYNNFSGVYSGVPISNVPSLLLIKLIDFGDFSTVSSIFETEKGVAIIFYYNHLEEIKPNPNNSWDLIYNYAKQKKQNRLFNLWVEKNKNKTFIKILYN